MQSLPEGLWVALKAIEDDYPYAYFPLTVEDDTINILEQQISVYYAESLSDAWVKAYPYYQSIFLDDPEFKNFVDKANGKWLEPKDDRGKLCVLLSTKNTTSEEMKYTLIHELRHCYDFIKSWNVWLSKGNKGIPPTQAAFSKWSEFNATYTDTILRLVHTLHTDPFVKLTSYLGYRTADCVNGILKEPENTNYYLSRYSGVQRAIRDLSVKNCPAPVFQLWHMTPEAILKNDSMIFYLATHYQKIDYYSFGQED